MLLAIEPQDNKCSWPGPRRHCTPAQLAAAAWLDLRSALHCSMLLLCVLDLMLPAHPHVCGIKSCPHSAMNCPCSTSQVGIDLGWARCTADRCPGIYAAWRQRG